MSESPYIKQQCGDCSRKDAKIKELEQEVSKLHAELDGLEKKFSDYKYNVRMAVDRVKELLTR